MLKRSHLKRLRRPYFNFMTKQRRNSCGRFSTSTKTNLRTIMIFLIIAISIWIILSPSKNKETINKPIFPTYEIAKVPTKQEQVQKGVASFYDYDLNRKDQKCLDNNCWSLHHDTCASRDFKRYSTLIVKRVDTGQEIECYVNDEIENPDRIIDLSSHAFAQLAGLNLGLIEVEVRYK
jgi:rare lipoprotein A (peptidoglycan hydrolase)